MEDEKNLIFRFSKTSTSDSKSSDDSKAEDSDTRRRNSQSNNDWRRRDGSTTAGSISSNWRDRSDSKETENSGNTSSQERRNYNSSSNRGNPRQTRDWYEILPSQVFDEQTICLPLNEEYEDDSDMTVNWGKWMIFPQGQLDKLDSYWIALKPLLESGILLKLKASTAGDPRLGVINCYTKNAGNKTEVKVAGDAIRKRIDYDYIMYYKTNKASISGQYRNEGFTLIAKYMHTKRGGFYVRDSYDRWKSYDEDDLI